MTAGPVEPPPEAALPLPRSRAGRFRILALFALIAGGIVLGKLSGLTHDLSSEQIRSSIARAGAWGYALYVAIFAGGMLLHVPGLVFVAAGVLAFGKLPGFLAAYFGALVAVGVSFIVVRSVGGRALDRIEHRFVRRALSHLDEHPLRTVTLLRTILWLAPPLNYTLALSNVSFGVYMFGSALGLVLPLAGATVFFEWLFR